MWWRVTTNPGTGGHGPRAARSRRAGARRWVARPNRTGERRWVARSGRTGARGCQTTLGLTATALLLTAAVALLALGSYVPQVTRAVPLLPDALHLLARWLPPGTAWLHDRGTDMLAPGAYLGWSDGARGELFLYGQGCNSEQNPRSGHEGRGGREGHGGITYLALRGPQGVLEFGASEVQQRWDALDQGYSYPIIRVALTTDRTLQFDRATLRCRHGTEATARIAATVVHAPDLATQRTESEAAAALVHGPDVYPGLGIAGRLTFIPRGEPLHLRAITYAPAAVATGAVVAAAGHRSSRQAWLAAAATGLATAATAALPSSPTPSPWDAGFQLPDAPQALRPRPAAALALRVQPGEVGNVFLTASSFRQTPWPRPVLLKPLISYEYEGRPGSLVSEGLAFAWTTTPRSGPP